MDLVAKALTALLVGAALVVASLAYVAWRHEPQQLDVRRFQSVTTSATSSVPCCPAGTKGVITGTPPSVVEKERGL